MTKTETIPTTQVDSIAELPSMIMDAMINDKRNLFMIDNALKLIIKSKLHETRLFFKFISFMSVNFEVFFILDGILWDENEIEFWK